MRMKAKAREARRERGGEWAHRAPSPRGAARARRAARAARLASGRAGRRRGIRPGEARAWRPTRCPRCARARRCACGGGTGGGWACVGVSERGAVWAGTHRSRNGPQAAASMLRRARRAAPAKRSRREKSVARRASGARARSWGCCGDGRGASGDGEGCGEGAEEEYGERDGGGDGERGGRGACEVDSGEVQKAGVGDGLDRGGTERCSGGGGGGGEEGKEREPGAA